MSLFCRVRLRSTRETNFTRTHLLVKPENILVCPPCKQFRAILALPGAFSDQSGVQAWRPKPQIPGHGSVCFHTNCTSTAQIPRKFCLLASLARGCLGSFHTPSILGQHGVSKEAAWAFSMVVMNPRWWHCNSLMRIATQHMECWGISNRWLHLHRHPSWARVQHLDLEFGHHPLWLMKVEAARESIWEC